MRYALQTSRSKIPWMNEIQVNITAPRHIIVYVISTDEKYLEYFRESTLLTEPPSTDTSISSMPKNVPSFPLLLANTTVTSTPVTDRMIKNTCIRIGFSFSITMPNNVTNIGMIDTRIPAWEDETYCRLIVSKKNEIPG